MKIRFLLLVCWNVIYKLIKNFKLLVKYAVCRSYFKIHNDSEINSPFVDLKARIGKKVRVDSDVIIRANTVIGDYTVINKEAVIESGSIGRFCSIAAEVAIGLGEHPLQLVSTHPAALWFSR
ncbi:hypothetical protein C0971_16805 [Bacillus methanolicus]|uniref:acyltransferase n=1 Tax=Bacillus methanolicus TaxID=1471 RepID=UPI002010B91A|nr:hypothetical protein [Bacillus methanolicus]UQD53494.1 hypothetical protein C0971_16805 [Bacillus methanolicus]